VSRSLGPLWRKEGCGIGGGGGWGMLDVFMMLELMMDFKTLVHENKIPLDISESNTCTHYTKTPQMQHCFRVLKS
jgi:hypothetical protein